VSDDIDTASAPPPPAFPAALPALRVDDVPQGTAASSSPQPQTVLALERRVQAPVRGTGPLDWIAFVLAFLVAPVGVVVAIVALVLGYRARGWVSGIAKAAVAIAVVLSVALGGGYALFANVQQKQAAHDAVIASSARWCGELRATPGVLQSPTYDWPTGAETVSASMDGMQKYVDTWTALDKVAPAGIEKGTASIATAAKGIIANVSSSHVLDDAANQSTMAQAVAASGVSAWVSEYCK